MKDIILSLTMGYFVLSCSPNSNLEEDLKQLQSQPIEIGISKMKCFINGRDTFLISTNLKKLKLIIYSDSTICSSCNLKNMPLWDDLLIKSEPYKNDIEYYFIFHPSKNKRKSFDLTMKTYSPYIPIYVDSLGVFTSINPHIPRNPALHTFLLDENNNVILVGNPLENKRIEEMFWRIVKEKLGEPKDSVG